MRLATMKRGMRGVTLLELLVAIAIFALLSSIAYPSYVQHIARSNRAAAKAVLLQVAERQEQFFADNKRYTADLTQLGYTSSPFMIDGQGQVVPSTDGDRLYAVTLTNTSSTTFTVNAQPQLVQAERDTRCQTLTLTQAARKGHTGAGDDCW